jgi:hypothetical protein
MGSAREALHVRPDLREQHLRNPSIDAGNAIEPYQFVLEGPELLRNLRTDSAIDCSK